jgi:hypothetical protein
MATEEYSIGYEDGKSAGFDECMAQQRTWVGLTDEEVNYLLEHTDWFEWPHLFAKAVESKLKEKNA